VAGAHLVGDRADPADAGGDVGSLLVRTAAKERLEESRRLEDLELDLFDDAIVDSNAEGASPSTRAT